MREINGKNMEMWNKKGFDVDDIAAELQVSPDEVIKAIRSNFQKKVADNMIRNLKKHKKRKEKYTQESSSSMELKEQINTTPEDDQRNQEEKLEELKAEREMILENNISLEIIRKKAHSSKIELRGKIENIDKRKNKLKKQLDEVMKELQDISMEIASQNDTIALCNLELQDGRKALEKVDRKIAKLEVIAISVSDEIKISISDLTIPNSWENVFTDIVLMEADEVEDLTKKQMRILSKCIVLKNMLELQARRYRFDFEEEVLKMAFEFLEDKVTG